MDWIWQMLKELANDSLQFSSTTEVYMNTLMDCVRQISEENEALNEAVDQQQDGDKKTSLGLVMEGKKGVFIGIIKGLNADNADLVLIKKNYHNLENLTDSLLNGSEDEDDLLNYLKLAKLNRLRILMDLSLKLIGRSFAELGPKEKRMLELEANRFQSTYPLPGEETLVEEIDEDGGVNTRMPIVLDEDAGAPVIDINCAYRLNPDQFLMLYSRKLLQDVEKSTGISVSR